jgi:hypothetical protein
MCVCVSLHGPYSRGATKFPDNKCLGTRPYKLDKDGKYTRLDKDGNPDPNPKTLPVRELYKYWTYKQVQEQATAFGAGLSKLGLVSQVRKRGVVSCSVTPTPHSVCPMTHTFFVCHGNMSEYTYHINTSVGPCVLCGCAVVTGCVLLLCFLLMRVSFLVIVTDLTRLMDVCVIWLSKCFVATTWGDGVSSSQDSVSIYSINRPEWTVVNLGNFSQSFRTVALYDTLGTLQPFVVLNSLWDERLV